LSLVAALVVVVVVDAAAVAAVVLGWSFLFGLIGASRLVGARRKRKRQ